MILNYLALLVILFVVILIAVVAVLLGTLPGKIARKRGHPQVDAVNAAAWMGVATLGILWPLAFIWAFIRAARASAGGAEHGPAATEEVVRLTHRVSELEAALKRLQAQRSGDAS